MHNLKLLISKTCTGNSKMATDGSLMAHLHTLNSVVLAITYIGIYGRLRLVRNWFVEGKWETL